MGVEILLAGEGSAEAVARRLARTVHETCPAPVPGGALVDRVEVPPGAWLAADTTHPGGPRARYVVPAEAFLVERGALDAAPNAVPATTSHPFTASVGLRAGVVPADGPVLVQDAVEVLGVPDGLLGGLGEATVPLGALFSGLGLPAPTTAATDVVGGSASFRWDPTGDAVDRLAGTPHVVGVFLAGADLVAMLRSRVASSLAALPGGAGLDGQWSAHDGVPHLHLSAAITVGPLTARVDVDVDLELLFLGGTPVLRAHVLWSTDVSGLPIVDDVVEKAFDDALEDALDPAKLGATGEGTHRFRLDTAVPLPSLPGIGVVVDQLLALETGMLLGGHLVPPVDLLGPVSVTASPLSGPARVQLCSVNARTGSGQRDTTPLSIATATSFGSATLMLYRHWCGTEVRPPELAPYVDVRVVEEGRWLEVRARVPYAAAQAASGPLRVLVRTTGGVRLIDLGRAPAVRVDANGSITSGVVDLYLPDCLLVDESARHRDWGSIIDGGPGKKWDLDDFRPVPLEWPDWLTALGGGVGLSSQLVTLTGLDAGELVRFRSHDHALDVTADSAGTAYVPVLLPLGDTVPAARLERLGGRSLGGRARIRTAAFVVGEPAADAEELNPQPLPPDPGRVGDLLGLDDVVDVVAVPGFEGGPVHVAVLGDGQQLLVARTPDGPGLRVAGTFSGPIGALVAGRGAYEATDGERVVRVLRR